MDIFISLLILLVGFLGGYAVRAMQLSDALISLDIANREIARLRNDLGKAYARRYADKTLAGTMAERA